jgi:hypothetical protein
MPDGTLMLLAVTALQKVIQAPRTNHGGGRN